MLGVSPEWKAESLGQGAGTGDSGEHYPEPRGGRRETEREARESEQNHQEPGKHGGARAELRKPAQGELEVGG